MQRILRILFGTAAAAGLLVASTVTANATIVTSVAVDGAADAAETAFLATLGASTTESFEGFTAPDHQTVFNTVVGSFTKGGSDGTGLCNVSGDCDKLAIHDNLGGAGQSPFDGRFAKDGDNWLDSNDNTLVTWAVSIGGGDFDSIGFFLTDASDVDGILTITFNDGTQTSEVFGVAPGDLDNGNLAYITAIFSPDVTGATVTFNNTSTNDGWGIDDIVVGLSDGNGGQEVPEPMTLGLLGLGLAGLGLIRRRRKEV